MCVNRCLLYIVYIYFSLLLDVTCFFVTDIAYAAYRQSVVLAQT